MIHGQFGEFAPFDLSTLMLTAQVVRRQTAVALPDSDDSSDEPTLYTAVTAAASSVVE
jgi:hypothetical protein